MNAIAGLILALHVVPPLVATAALWRRRRVGRTSSLVWAMLLVLLTALVHAASYVAGEDSGNTLPRYWFVGLIAGVIAAGGVCYFALVGSRDRVAQTCRLGQFVDRACTRSA